jgi:hypothetical protein
LENRIKQNTNIIILLPSARVGGAEKNALMLYEELINNYNVKLVLGISNGGSNKIINNAYLTLGCERLRFNIFKIFKLLLREKPNILILNLGYIFIAPFVRLFFPKMKIVCRLGNTISSELSSNIFYKFIVTTYLRFIVISSDILLTQSENMKLDLLKVVKTDRNNIKILRNPPEFDFEIKYVEKNRYNFNNYIF